MRLNDRKEYILTAAHIFREGQGEIIVTLQNGNVLAARMRNKSDTWDVALLQLFTKLELDTLPLSDKAAKLGEETWAWGFGPDGSVDVQKGRAAGYVQTAQTAHAQTLRTTGRAREGDSGGPVLNHRDELIGLLWGTDGRYTYATASERLKIILLEEMKKDGDFALRPPAPELFDPTVLPKPVPESLGISNAISALMVQGWKRCLETTTMKMIAGVVGVGSPILLLLYCLKRLISRKKQRSTSNMETGNEKKSVALNDQYARQLNSLYELSGHSSVSDATLGRLYDIKLRDAEQSSSSETAALAKKLRKQVAEQFLRIHSSNPTPTEQ